MAEGLALHLDSVGYDHYVALACTRALCERMHASWPASAPQLSCAFSSEPFASHPGAGLDTEWQRYHVLSLVAEQGYDAMLIEPDFAVHHDIYQHLQAAPLKNYHLVALKTGHHADSGAMFVRGSAAHKDGAALWVLREARQTHLGRHATPP